MKILIISGSFYPDNSPRAFRTTELAKRFCKLGHDVTVYIPNKYCKKLKLYEKIPLTLKFYAEVQLMYNVGVIVHG